MGVWFGDPAPHRAGVARRQLYALLRHPVVLVLAAARPVPGNGRCRLGRRTLTTGRSIPIGCTATNQGDFSPLGRGWQARYPRSFSPCALLQRALAAFLALSARCSAVNFFALASPPLRPPRRPSAAAALLMSLLGFFFILWLRVRRDGIENAPGDLLVVFRLA